MPFLFRSKSSGHAQTKTSTFNEPPRSQFFDHTISSDDYQDEDEEEYEEEEEEDEDGDCSSKNSPLTTAGRWSRSYGGDDGNSSANNNNNNNNNSNSGQLLDLIMAAVRRSLLVTCTVDRDDDVSSVVDISWPTEVKHVSHVTFDRFNGFLGLPIELQHKIPDRVPSASVRVFGVSATSMQCSYDERGNSVPTILLTMQKHLYSEGGLQAEGIFRINAENSQEEFVRSQLNKGLVPNGIDVHCLAGLIKAWLRELPSGVLDALTPEQVMHCNTEEECSKLVKLLPQMEASLLDWSINLMADVVQHESYNKMNARNIAMVFAPNMTQMADPLTALIHAVQVMNFLKTLILKTIRQREEVSAKATLSLPSLCPDSPNTSTHEKTPTSTPTTDPCQPISRASSASIYLDRSLQGKLGKQETQSPSSPPKQSEVITDSLIEFEVKETGDGRNNGDWLSWRKGVRKVCQHSVFQLSKQISLKKTRSFGFLSGNGRGGSGEAWA